MRGSIWFAVEVERCPARGDPLPNTSDFYPSSQTNPNEVDTPGSEWMLAVLQRTVRLSECVTVAQSSTMIQECHEESRVETDVQYRSLGFPRKQAKRLRRMSMSVG